MGIVFFDMDKTLTREVSAVFLGTEVGKKQEIDELERLIAAKEITDEEFDVGVGKLVRGYTIEELRRVYEKMPVIEGMPETVQALKNRGLKLAIVTLGVGEFARFMCEDYGFDYFYGSLAIVEDSVIQGFGPPFLTREGKAEYVKELCKKQGIDPKNCFAVGDSDSDIHMFNEVGTSIALNYSDDLIGHATHYIRPCHNLAEIITRI